MRSRSGFRSWEPKSQGVCLGDHGHAGLLVGAQEHRPALLADVDLAGEVERHRHLVAGLRDVRGDLGHVLGQQVRGAPWPGPAARARPSGRPRGPTGRRQLTTCSAWIVSPLSTRTSQVPSGRCSRPDDRRVLVDLGAGQLGALHVGAGDARSGRRAPRPGRRARRRSTAGRAAGRGRAASRAEMSSSSMPEVAAARLRPSAGSPCGPRCRPASARPAGGSSSPGRRPARSPRRAGSCTAGAARRSGRR